jgi:hypothetical protein
MTTVPSDSYDRTFRESLDLHQRHMSNLSSKTRLLKTERGAQLDEINVSNKSTRFDGGARRNIPEQLNQPCVRGRCTSSMPRILRMLLSRMVEPLGRT